MLEDADTVALRKIYESVDPTNADNNVDDSAIKALVDQLIRLNEVQTVTFLNAYAEALESDVIKNDLADPIREAAKSLTKENSKSW